MLLYAFRDDSGHWHGDPGTETLDGEPGTGFLRYEPLPGGTTSYAGQCLPVLYGPCALEASAVEVHLEDGSRVRLTWHVFELLEAGPCPPDDLPLPPPGALPPPPPAFAPTPQATPCSVSFRAPWSPEEEQRCRDRYLVGDSPEAIAALLGRTVKAVRFRLAHLGLAAFPADLLPVRPPNALPPPARRPPAPDSHRARMQQRYPNAYARWTPEEDTIVVTMTHEGAAVEEIAECLQRQPSAVETRMERLGLLIPAGDLRCLPSWDDEDDGDDPHGNRA